MASVLFVCLGNICRSPTAEAVFRQKASKAGLNIKIESAGTSGAHQGEPPDRRSVAAGQCRGYSFKGQTSRRVTRSDFFEFDYILAMDANNLSNLRRIRDQLLREDPDSNPAEPNRFLEYAYGATEIDVPDPYYGGPKGFDHVLDLIEQASDGLIAEIAANA
jgi:protein-tyrosine phosphatase